jgi:hypothetical protein
MRGNFSILSSISFLLALFSGFPEHTLADTTGQARKDQEMDATCNGESLVDLTEILPNEILEKILMLAQEPESTPLVNQRWNVISESKYVKTSIIEHRMREQENLLKKLSELISKMSENVNLGNGSSYDTSERLGLLKDFTDILKTLDENYRIGGVVQPQLKNSLNHWAKKTKKGESETNAQALGRVFRSKFLISHGSALGRNMVEHVINNWQTLSEFDFLDHAALRASLVEAILLNTDSKGFQAEQLVDLLGAYLSQTNRDLENSRWDRLLRSAREFSDKKGLFDSEYLRDNMRTFYFSILGKITGILQDCLKEPNEEVRIQCEKQRRKLTEFLNTNKYIGVLEMIRSQFLTSDPRTSFDPRAVKGSVDYLKNKDIPELSKLKLAILFKLRSQLPNEDPQKAEVSRSINQLMNLREIEIWGNLVDKLAKIKTFKSDYVKQRALAQLTDKLIQDKTLFTFKSPLEILLSEAADNLPDGSRLNIIDSMIQANRYKTLNFPENIKRVKDKSGYSGHILEIFIRLKNSEVMKSELDAQDIVSVAREVLPKDDFKKWSQDISKYAPSDPQDDVHDVEMKPVNTFLGKRKRAEPIKSAGIPPNQVGSVKKEKEDEEEGSKRKEKKVKLE